MPSTQTRAKQNLEVTSEAENVFNSVAKTNKLVYKSKNLPWFAIFTIQGESIGLDRVYPEAGAERLEVEEKDYVESVWEPLVDMLTSDYLKNACYVVVDVLYVSEDGNTYINPVFFKWCPDTGVPLRTKMLAGAAFQSVKKRFDVGGVTPELSQRSELDFNTFAHNAKLPGFKDV